MKIKISGNYGDVFSLYTDGYVYTKYGDFLKIMSVDIESETVHTYFGGSFDFSRISHSSEATKKVNKSYIEYLKEKLHSNGIRIGSELCYREGLIAKIDDVIIPDMIKIFNPLIFFSIKNNDGTESKSSFEISDFNELNKKFKIIESSIPYTLEEKIVKILKSNTKGNGYFELEKATSELMELLSK